MEAILGMHSFGQREDVKANQWTVINNSTGKMRISHCPRVFDTLLRQKKKKRD